MTTRDFIKKTYGTPGTRERFCSSVFTDERGNVYSYGRHYPLLFKVGGLDFVNTTGYSNTTAKHINWARSATNYTAIPVKLNGLKYPEDFTLADMLTLLKSELNSIIIDMASKKRKDTRVYEMLDDKLARVTEYIKRVKAVL